MSSDHIYLDAHATTPCDPRVREAMWPWFTERYGNAASVHHDFGRGAAEAVEIARSEIATCLGCQPQEIIFTSGATEANNLALKGVLQASHGRRELIVNAAEHRAILDPARRLRREGCSLTILPVDAEARVDPDAVSSALSPATALVSVMLANNEVGTINRIAEIAERCQAQGVPLHCDAAQAVGHIPVNLTELPVALMSLTAHKLSGPQGIGALFVRRTDPPLPIVSQLDGGGHERRLRSGTLPVALIVGFGTACRLAAAELQDEASRLRRLRGRLWEQLSNRLSGISLNGPSIGGDSIDRLPGNLHVSFEGVDGDALMAGLNGLAVSSGSACTSADPEPSHVLRAMGVDERLSLSSLRFGLGRFATEDEIDRAAMIVSEAVTRLRPSR